MSTAPGLGRTHGACRALAAFAALSASLALLVLTGCAVNPVTGKRELSLVSADQEVQIGRDGYAATLAEYGQYDDAKLQAYVDSVGKKLARVSELPNLDWHFTVLDDPVVNAFAMPGGYIYITRGILAHLNSEAQLAGVLGHEIGHVTARHSAKHITQQQLAGLGLGLAGAFSETFARYSGAAEQALGLLMLKYSRDDESQSDALGIKYAVAAGYDPREIPATYAMLKRIGERGGSSLPFYLSTHPDPGDREARTTALAEAAVGTRTGLLVQQKPYMDRLRGVVFGEDPRGGYFDGARFYQPGMGFELLFPEGWAKQNSHSSLVAQEPSKAAFAQVTLAPNAGTLSPLEYVAALKRDGRIASASGSVETVGGWPAWVGHVVVPPANGATSGTVLFAAFVRQSPERLIQFLGQSKAIGDANDLKLVALARSLRPLQDARRANPVPDRVVVGQAPSAGVFNVMIGRLGPMAISLDDAAILNGRELDERVITGDWLKSVAPGKKL
ncbi:MAG: M48 family metalloprotease [Candidatus Eisenbacteria bacterium]|uniref:M48 family metalloprotease n=1 Tax=Eiseniibacteriota bacterium TaxID=2212470 RepID=A0A933WBT2_UNCEI|nr:M48 family metalloprotease [Candidatus Eisenbacteria bacterium]